MTAEDRDEAALAPFIAAERAAAAPPPAELLGAILVDAAKAGAARRRRRLTRLLDPVGGWRAAAALALCAAAGFWIGLSEDTPIDGGTLWAGSTADPADPVAAFFDLGAEDGA
jgi:hypothetical protein